MTEEQKENFSREFILWWQNNRKLVAKIFAEIKHPSQFLPKSKS